MNKAYYVMRTIQTDYGAEYSLVLGLTSSSDTATQIVMDDVASMGVERGKWERQGIDYSTYCGWYKDCDYYEYTIQEMEIKP